MLFIEIAFVLLFHTFRLGVNILKAAIETPKVLC